ncbi:MAG: hypothetical protein K6G40_04750 [Eubacterium sp.]|nr:hypothetical protein [Eubacterium sp.]
MSEMYRCNDCGRGFTSKQASKAGLNKMFKAVYFVPVTSTLSAGEYAINPVRICPWCLSDNTGRSNEVARVDMLVGILLRKYPKIDILRYKYKQVIQCNKDAFINANLITGEMLGMSREAEGFIKNAIAECAPDGVNEENEERFLRKIGEDFWRPFIVYSRKKDEYCIRKGSKKVFVAKYNNILGEYEISGDGQKFFSSKSDGKELEKILDRGLKAMEDYAVRIEMP